VRYRFAAELIPNFGFRAFKENDNYASDQGRTDISTRSNALPMFDGFMVLLKSILMMENSLLQLPASSNSTLDSLTCLDRSS
jgi:hypothetical protein